jgi:hypothetical protein
VFGLSKQERLNAALLSFERVIRRSKSPELRGELTHVLTLAERVYAAVVSNNRANAEAGLRALSWHVADKLVPMPAAYSRLSKRLREAVGSLKQAPATVRAASVNAEIFERVRLPNNLSVTLYDWMAEDVRDGCNLVATNRAGLEVWRAKPVLFNDPRQQDCFTSLRWDGVTLMASTFSCYDVSVDPDNGDVAIIAFTK